jgi:pseudouridine kinase
MDSHKDRPHADMICIGGANVDRKLRTLAVLQMGTSNPSVQFEAFGGVARNVAENLARLGLPTQLISAVGDDAAGRALMAQAASVGLSTQNTWVARDAATGSYTAVLDDGGQMVLALAAMPLIDGLTPQFLRRSSAERARARLTALDLNLPASSVAALLEEARERGGALVAVAVSEPKMSRLPRDLRGLQCLILNRGELRALLPEAGSDTAAFACLHGRGVRQIVLTQGAAGIVCSEVGGAVRHLPAPAVEVVDVTGAGDALAAGICAGLYEFPHDIDTACQIGLRLAALTLQTTVTVHPDLNPAWLGALHPHLS